MSQRLSDSSRSQVRELRGRMAQAVPQITRTEVAERSGYSRSYIAKLLLLRVHHEPTAALAAVMRAVTEIEAERAAEVAS